MANFKLIRHLVNGDMADVVLNVDDISSIQEIPNKEYCIITMHNGMNFIVAESLKSLYNKLEIDAYD